MLIYLAPNFASRCFGPVYKIRISQGFRGHARLYESVKKFHLPESTVKAVANSLILFQTHLVDL